MLGTLLGVLLAAAVTGTFSLATARAAGRAAIRTNENTTRSDIEKEAFDRAKSYYTDTIDRQDKEIKELVLEIRSLKEEIRELKALLGKYEPPPS